MLLRLLSLSALLVQSRERLARRTSDKNTCRRPAIKRPQLSGRKSSDAFSYELRSVVFFESEFARTIVVDSSNYIKPLEHEPVRQTADAAEKIDNADVALLLLVKLT